MENGSLPRSLQEELLAEFGMPDFKVNSSGEGKKYFEGVRCDLNLGCTLVNTPRCDILRCQRPALQVSKLFDAAIE
ncbi:MAG: hypothetical protein NTV24_01815 [Candidatus Woesebacteria bacterium]|nr:hypothetical protein [Candidatus Woesebacteria bacterium]